MQHPELSISLDSAISAGNLSSYLAEVNTWPNVSVHLDIMRRDMVGHDRCTDADIAYVLKNSHHPIDIHVMGEVPTQLLGFPSALEGWHGASRDGVLNVYPSTTLLE